MAQLKDVINTMVCSPVFFLSFHVDLRKVDKLGQFAKEVTREQKSEFFHLVLPHWYCLVVT
jgi:hypothetical protein